MHRDKEAACILFCLNKTLFNVGVLRMNEKQRGKGIVRLKKHKGFCMIGSSVEQASIHGWFDCCTNKN